MITRSPREVRHEVAEGRWERVRHGTYDAAIPLTAQQHHRRLITTTAEVVKPGAVISHFSAALLHGLPVSERTLERVWITRTGEPKTRRTRHLVIVNDEPDPAPMIIDGLVVGSLERTAVEVACRGRFIDAVATFDAALARGADRSALKAECHRRHGYLGIGRARQALSIANPRSESVGESFSRALIFQQGLPMPELQVELRDARGLMGRVDFLWRAKKLVGEFDGKVKYGLGRTEPWPDDASLDPAEVLWAEKRREDRMRRAGFSFERWGMADLFPPDVWLTRLTDRLRG